MKKKLRGPGPSRKSGIPISNRCGTTDRQPSPDMRKHTDMTSSLENIKHITVIGSGTMGSQIGMVSALAGFNTTIVDISQESLDEARTMLETRMARDVEKQRRSPEEVETAMQQLRFSLDRDTVVSTSDFIIEAAVEDIDIKRRLFSDLDEIAPP